MVRSQRLPLALGGDLVLSLAFLTGLGLSQGVPGQDLNRTGAQQPGPGRLQEPRFKTSSAAKCNSVWRNRSG